MNESWFLALALIAGVFLGGLFFGGLWWTVRKGVASAHPALWFLGSSLLRTGIVVAGFYLVAQGDWRRLLICFVGFLSARFAVTRMTGPPLAARGSPAKEADHAH